MSCAMRPAKAFADAALSSASAALDCVISSRWAMVWLISSMPFDWMSLAVAGEQAVQKAAGG